MKKTLITIVVLGVILGAIWFVGRKAEAPVTNEPVVNTKPELTPELILNSNGFVNGEREDTEVHSSWSIPKQRLVFGDLDGDGSPEAVAPRITCGASCGQSIYAFKLSGDKVLMGEIDGTSVAGAAQEVRDLYIKDGLVTVTEADFDGIRTHSYSVEFVNGEIVSKQVK